MESGLAQKRFSRSRPLRAVPYPSCLLYRCLVDDATPWGILRILCFNKLFSCEATKEVAVKIRLGDDNAKSIVGKSRSQTFEISCDRPLP